MQASSSLSLGGNQVSLKLLDDFFLSEALHLLSLALLLLSLALLFLSLELSRCLQLELVELLRVEFSQLLVVIRVPS